MSNSISNAQGPIAPGETVSIYGTNLASATVSNCAGSSGFPTTCGTTTVQINNIAAPLIYISATQVNCYAPLELYGGPVNLVVTVGGASSSPFSLNVAPASPAIDVVETAGGAIISATNLASAGQTVVAYAVGLGITNPQGADGVETPSSPFYHPAATVGVTVGGVPATVGFSALTAGLVGLYQVNFTIPSGLLGNQPLVFTADGIASPPVTLYLTTGTPPALSVTTSSSLGTLPLGEIQIGLGASGGTGSYAWTVQNGSTLPPGLALRGDLPSYITPFAPEGLIGVATTPGTYTFGLSVSSGASTATPSFTLKVTGLTLKDGPTLPDGFVGTPYYNGGYQLSATDNGAAATINCTSTTAAGFTLSSGCLLSGTPTTAGAQTLSVTFTNGVDTVTRPLTVNVSAVQITGAGLLPNAPKGVAYSSTLAASGGSSPYSYALSGMLPGGLALNSGVISGTPSGALGKYNFAITVTDSASHSYTRNMAIDVTGTPVSLPQIEPYGDLGDCTIGMGCTRAIAVSAGGTAPFTWSATGLPPGMAFRFASGSTLAYVSPSDLELWGTPTALGAYNVTVKATDAAGSSVTQVFPLKVSALFLDTCTTVTFCPGMPGGSLETAYAGAFRVVGGVPPYTATQISSRDLVPSLPDGLWLSPTAVTGIPLEGGPFSPLFQFSDSAGTANTLTLPQTLDFSGASDTTTVVNAYPIQYLPQNRDYEQQLSACCAASYDWTQAGGTEPTGITILSSGLLAGTPSVPGTYDWLLQATQAGDANNYGTRQLDFVVTPIAMSAGTLVSGLVGQGYNQSLSVSGNTGAVTWALAPGNLLPPGLTLNRNNGQISGDPTSQGGYAFSVFATDSANNVGLGNAAISIYTACDISQSGSVTVAELQLEINEALGSKPPVNDPNQDGVVNVVDLQTMTNAALGMGCSASAP